MSRQLSQQEIDAVFQNMQDRKREAPAVKFDFRRPGPHPQIPGPRHPPAARHVRPQPGLQPLGLSAFLPDRQPGQRGAALVRRISGRPALAHLHGFARPQPLRRQRRAGTESLAGVSDSGDAAGRQRASPRRRSSATSPKSSRSCWTACSASSCRICGRPGKPVTTVDFTIESMETEPQLLHMLAPNEAVVSIGIEVRIGETVGMMNIAMPSIVIKMMRQKFDQQWSVRKTHASEAEQARVLRLLREALLAVEARLEGPTLTVRDLLSLDRRPPADRSITRWSGRSSCWSMARTSSRPRWSAPGKRRACLIEQIRRPAGQGRISEDGAGSADAGSADRSRAANPETRVRGAGRCSGPARTAAERPAARAHRHRACVACPSCCCSRFRNSADGVLHRAVDVRRQRVGRHALVVDAALQRPVGADQRRRAPPGRRNRPRRASPARRPPEDRPEECRAAVRAPRRNVLGDLDVPVRNRASSIGVRLFVLPRLLQKLAIERAVHRHFALGAAADGADVAADARAEAPRTAGLANRARHSLSIEVEGNRRPNEPHESILQSRNRA